MFEKALKLGLRFNYKGVITTEDLFNLRLEDLDILYTDLNDSFNKHDRGGLLSKKNDVADLIAFKMEVVKKVYDVKLEEQEKVNTSRELKNKKAELARLIEDKKNEAKKNLTLEELQKLYDELKGE